VDYTLGKATKNDKQVTQAKADLDAYRTSFGQLINSVVPELPADAVAEELSRTSTRSSQQSTPASPAKPTTRPSSASRPVTCR
jgi:hypothetical protein